MKLQCLYLCLVAMMGILPAMAQENVGVQFLDKPLGELLLQAKQENKLVFIDCYSTYCGPCKAMLRKEFPKKEMGDYLNADFVSAKMNLDLGEGPELSKKWDVHSFPTFLFLDSDGNILHRMVGYMPADEFIQKAKEGLADNSFRTLEKKYQQDKLVLEADLQEAQRQCDQVDFQMRAANDQLREAEDQVLRLQGQEKQYEILLDAIVEAETSAQKERDALNQRSDSDRERYTAQQAKIQVYTQQLAETRQALAQLEGSQTEADAASNAITETMTQRKTEEAALDAERSTALAHIADLQGLRTAMEGDREKKEALMASIREDNLRLEQEIEQLRQRQAENRLESTEMNVQMQKTMESRAEAEASKTRAEREAQEKNKDILNMERACALLEQKKVTSSMEERQIIDRLWDSYGLTPGTAPEHRGTIENVAAGNRRAAELKRKISALGTPNLGAIEEYARINERYTYLAEQRDDVLNSKRELESVIRDITAEMTTIFVSEFSRIDHYFGQTFEEMFGGGKGQLILEDPEDPLSCGIEIRVQPPGKQVKTITLLSGGEKAFVATALYFAILKVRPTPFCILDEIDAALDDRNVERFAHYLHNLSQKTQFIVITHRRGTMEASDVLYGVTMQEQGVSKLLRLDLNQMEEYLGIVE